MARNKTITEEHGIVSRRLEISIPENAFQRLDRWTGGDQELMKEFIISAIWGRLTKLSELEDPVGRKRRKEEEEEEEKRRKELLEKRAAGG